LRGRIETRNATETWFRPEGRGDAVCLYQVGKITNVEGRRQFGKNNTALTRKGVG